MVRRYALRDDQWEGIKDFRLYEISRGDHKM